MWRTIKSKYCPSISFFFFRGVWIDHYHLCPGFHTTETTLVHVKVPFSCYCTLYVTELCVFGDFLRTLWHFVMLIIGSMHLISVQSWTSTSIPGLFMEPRLLQQISRLLKEEMGERVSRVSKDLWRFKNGRVYFECEIFKESTSQYSLVGSLPSIILAWMKLPRVRAPVSVNLSRRGTGSGL